MVAFRARTSFLVEEILVAMGFYARHVLPRLIDLAMRSGEQEVERRRLVPLARGRVIEIGFGSGLNLPFYGPDVARLAAVDPSAELWRLARERVRRAAVAVDFTQASAERLPFDAGTFDTAVMTWTLCSIADPEAALREIRRLLAPTGRLLFIEHGRAPDAGVRAWQDRLTPAWKRVAGGCHLDREIDRLLAGAGFHVTRGQQGYGRGPRVFAYLYKGVAERAR
jgi:ubiquinone/menaquinone biosynthesis C-methylase UbiE